MLSSGKILIGGANRGGLTGVSNAAALVEELNADGSVNTSFGANGLATVDYTPNDIVFGDARDMTETSDGKIIVAGNSEGFGVAARFDWPARFHLRHQRCQRDSEFVRSPKCVSR